MVKKELVRMRVSDLIPYERNPRKIPEEAVEDVRESIRQCGDLDIDGLFTDAEHKEKKAKTVVCPNCGEEFELE